MIFEGKTAIIPLSKVQYCQKTDAGLVIIMDGTTYSAAKNSYENSCLLCGEQQEDFLKQWKSYLTQETTGTK